MSKNDGWLYKFRSRTLTAAVVIIMAISFAGCSGSSGDPAVASDAAAKHVILIVGDGMQFEHERAYNNYVTGSYDTGLEMGNFPYKGQASTWDVTTYNRYAYTAGAATITDSGFDPRVTASFTAALGYDPAKGGKLPYAQDAMAAVNSPAAMSYYGAKLKLRATDGGAVPATDSASAATALATGFKTDDGNIAWRPGDPDNGSLVTIAEMYRNQKKAAMGVISTVPFSHATPAAFVSHNISRNNYQAITKEIITQVRPEVVIGGGHPAYNDKAGISGPAAYQYIGAPEYANLQSSTEYVLAERTSGVDGGSTLLAKADEAISGKKKLFGLFGGVGGSFEYHNVSNDGTTSITRGSIENPTLAQASTAALKVLSHNKNGFFLMIEQGDIDWANHADDYQGLIGGMWDLDQAVRAVEAFIDQPGDGVDWSNTLVIITSDHGNSFMRIDTAKKLAKGKLPQQNPTSDGGAPSGYAPNVSYYYPGTEITYGFDGKGLNSHTNEPVTVYARGAGTQKLAALEGTWYPGTKLLDNTQLYSAMMDWLELTDENRATSFAPVFKVANAKAVRALAKPFTIAALPDTQVYAEEGLIEFQKQIEWVLDNAAGQNIVFVTHLGDVVDNGTDVDQWSNAMEALDPLLAQNSLPFSIVRGNHDDPAFFLNNIPVATIKGKPWFVGAAPSGLTQAQMFLAENARFLHIGFQKDPAAAEIAWANALLARPDMQGLPVIVSTHDYIDGSGQSTTGRLLWNDFVRKNPMVFMVLNGHTHTEYALVNHNDANRPVYQMLSDYQDRALGGNGFMRLITIDPVQAKIVVKTFSPYFRADEDDTNPNLHYFETDADSQFEYAVNVKERLASDTTFDFGAEPPPPPLPPLNYIPAAVHYSHIFQNRRPLVGATTPYAGTVDVQINENNATINYGGEATLTTDMDDNGSRVHAFLRFDNIIGTNPGQIPPGATITSAKLIFSATSSTKGKVKMHRMLTPWGEHSTWMDFTPVNAAGQPTWEALTYFNYDTGIYTTTVLPSVMVGGGVQADNAEAMAAVDATFTMPKPIPVPFVLQPGGYGTVYKPPAASGHPAENLTVNLSEAVQAWVNGQPNYGWFFEPTGSDGWDFETAEGKQPPALVVEVAGSPLVQ
ncbi:MAG: alkaline phosphatase [Syntrophales bacterium]